MWSYFEYAEYVCDGGCVAAGEGVQQVVGQARHDIDDETRLQIVAAQQLLWGKHVVYLSHWYINRIDEGVYGSGMGLFLIGGHLLKILPQNSKGAS